MARSDQSLSSLENGNPIEKATLAYEEDLIFEDTKPTPARHVVRTLQFKWMQIFFLTLLLLSLILMPLQDDIVPPNTITYFLIVFHLFTSACFSVTDYYTLAEHARLEALGYHHFLGTITKPGVLPLYILSATNSILLTSFVLRESLCDTKSDYCPYPLKSYHIVIVILVVEVVCLIPPMFLYVLRCVRFNRRHLSEATMLKGVSLSLCLHEIQTAHRDVQCDADKLHELQIDFIVFLSQQQVALNRRLMHLLEKKERKMKLAEVAQD